MKKFLIPVLSIMLLLPFMYGGCLSSDDVASLIPDDIIPPNLNEMLIGTWFGTGEYSGPPPANGAINAQVNGSIFATIRIEVTDDGEGGVDAEFFINGQNIADLAGTVDVEISSDLADPLVTEANVIVLEFAPGFGLSSGGLIFDDDFAHAFFFIHDEAFADDVAFGVVEKGASAADIAGGFSRDDMIGMWAGSDYAFIWSSMPEPWDIEYLGKNSGQTATNWDLTMSAFSVMSVEVTGTNPQGGSISSGELYASAPSYGFFIGGFMQGAQSTSMNGFLSPDRSFFGGFLWYPDESRMNEWSDIVLTKTGPIAPE
jgi:hypothetical protein